MVRPYRHKLAFTLAILALAGLVAGCLPPEVDTPPLNAKAMAAEGDGTATCVPGVYGYAIDNQVPPTPYAGECTVPGVHLTSDPEKLKILKHIKHVQHAIIINGSIDLATAMPELESCGSVAAGSYSGAVLTGPPSLKSMDEFSAGLKYVTKITGFNGITSLKKLHIQDSSALTTLDAFAALTQVDTLSVTNNKVLTSITGLGALTQVGSLTITGNAALVNLPNFALLTQVQGNLAVNGPAIQKLHAFPALQSAAGLTLGPMPQCATLEFPQLTALHTLSLAGMPALTALTGLPKVAVDQKVKLCLEKVPCAEVAAFGLQHAPLVPQATWTDCAPAQACRP